MNWEHLRAFLWLQSRLRANKSKRTGDWSETFHTILKVLAVIIGIAAFCVSVAVGLYLLRTESPSQLLFVWTVMVGIFCMVWLLTLLTELQRSELMPLEKFIHYPVSVSSLFLINFAASILSEHVAIVFFIPSMLGLSLGLVLGRGVGMLWLFPLLAAFILMVTAATYQFRGWLAVLMLNKRHRRTVMAVVTISSMLLFQLPYLSTRVFGSRRARSTPVANSDDLGRTATMVTMIVPVGWLPYGAKASAEGRSIPPLLCVTGMTLIGVVSLRRSYRTTIRLYTGDYGSGRTKVAPAAPPMNDSTSLSAHSPALRARSLLDLEIPVVSEHALTVALATFRSLTRAPEVKMTLLSPLILIFFGSRVMKMMSFSSEFARPLMASGILAMILLTMGQLVMNQFAYDRSGFRNYVLTSVTRRDILLGKNLAIAPVILGLSGLAVISLQWFLPMRIDHFVAVLFQMFSMCLSFFLLANLSSILNPVAIAAGSLRPAVRPSLKTILFGFLVLFLFPVALFPSMVPLGMEFLFHRIGWLPGVPIFLLLSVVEAVGAGFLYLWLLEREGGLLQSRELKILEIVAARAGES